MTEINKIDIEDLKRRMTGGITSLKNDFAGLRTGRASASLLDPITIDAYGSKLPINQLSSCRFHAELYLTHFSFL